MIKFAIVLKEIGTYKETLRSQVEASLFIVIFAHLFLPSKYNNFIILFFSITVFGDKFSIVYSWFLVKSVWWQRNGTRMKCGVLVSAKSQRGT